MSHMLRVLSSLALICLTPVALAQTPDAASAPTARAADSRQCIGLVLGGGGARGSAHIGVLKVLERERIPICNLAGTSMGSIVGGLYAAGYSATELEAVLTNLDWTELFRDDPPREQLPMRRKDDDFRDLLNFELGVRDGRVVTPPGFIQGQKLTMLLRRLVLSTWDVHDFNELPIPFRAVATDISTGQPVVFKEGDLAMAMRASMSVPGAFAPLRLDDYMLVDGGIVDNVPVDVARQMGSDVLIVVDVGAPLGKRSDVELGNPVSVMSRMIDTLMRQKTESTLATLTPEDLLITPELGDMSSANFGNADSAVVIGEQAAEALVPELRRFSVSPEAYAAYKNQHRQRDFDPGLIKFVDVLVDSTASPRFVERSMAPNVGKPFDVDRIEQDIGSVYGRGNYQNIHYRPAERDSEYGIEVIPVDKPWGPMFAKFGLQINDNFNGYSDYQLSAQLTVTNLNTFGAEWRTNLWSGRVAGLRTEFHQPFGDFGHFYATPSLMTRTENVSLFEDNDEVAKYRVRRSIAALEAGYSPVPYWRLRAALVRGRVSGQRLIGDPVEFPTVKSDFAGVRMIADWDTLDNADFPTSGARVSLRYELYNKAAGGEVDSDVARLTGDWVWRWGAQKRYRLLMGLRMSSALDDNDDFIEAQDFLGGFLNLSGHAERSLVGNQTAFGRAVFFRRMGEDRLFSVPLFVGGSLEAGNAWRSKDLISADDLIYSGSVFAGISTFLGPLFLGYGHASDGANSWYLTFGSLLRPRETE
ncbi:NTE family protein [Luteimonas cucumeris]|uniref:NTE family protein n=1 Tax=Luteimonas cucumeris TaxID=985012 RepID=A0A562L865_9GAMM|nr:patatin-like phospholipase family protein [Luteimonas cucumeris]TWI03823.1 NTE family protein [Luteimonas cucumeris]